MWPFKPDPRRLWEKGDLPGLVSLLTHKDYQVREKSAVAIANLAEAGDQRAMDALIKLLTDVAVNCSTTTDTVLPVGQSNDLLYVIAGQVGAIALGKLGEKRAVMPLCAAVKQGRSMNLRKAAAEALGRLRDPRAIEPLKAVWGEWADKEHQAVVGALNALGESTAGLQNSWPSQYSFGDRDPRYIPWYVTCPPEAARDERRRTQWSFQFGVSAKHKLHVENPTAMRLQIGLRCIAIDFPREAPIDPLLGVDFGVAAQSSGRHDIGDGQYAVYFRFADDPNAVYRGNDITIKGNSVQISLKKVPGGNYALTRV